MNEYSICTEKEYTSTKNSIMKCTQLYSWVIRLQQKYEFDEKELVSLYGMYHNCMTPDE